MEKRVLGTTGHMVSIITFGGIMVEDYDAEKADRLVSFAIENGVNYFDSAPSYGNSQYALGPALEPYRKDVILACKTGKRDAEGAKAELLESLKAHKTDYFDVYQLHGVSDLEEIEQIYAPGGAMETFHWALKEGLTRHIGFTSHFDGIALQLLENSELQTMLFPVNFALREKKNLSVGPLEHWARSEGGAVAINSLLERKWREGEEEIFHCWYRPIFEDRKLATAALNYTLTRKGVATAVPPGDERVFRLAVEIIKEQGGAAREPNAEEAAYLMEFAEKLGESDFLF